MTFQARESLLAPGEMLFAFTDGVTDARDVSGRFYSEARLLGLLAPAASTAGALLERVEEAVAAHSAGAERTDDITMLAIRRTG
jgi:serine phosphatase RsbU (regulator of sigma subunit)